MNPALAQTAPPIAIGGIGGSGTRLVAELVRALGVHLGDDLNAVSDNLWFTLLFKRREILDCDDAQFDRLLGLLVRALRGDPLFDPAAASLLEGLSGSDRLQHSATWLKQRRDSLLASLQRPQPRGRWGWKEPNTHILIERLWRQLPQLRYVHVVRHGLDMAFSRNQNQLQLWGAEVLGADGPITPARALAYWCAVHRHMQDLLAANPARMYWLDYDALCRHPEAEAGKLCRFLGNDPAALAPVLDTIRKPGEPRHAAHSLDGMAAVDIAFVESLGYPVHPASLPA